MKQITLSLAFLLYVVLSAVWLAATPRVAAAAVPELPADIERLYNGRLYRQAAESLNGAIQREPQESSLHYWLGRSVYELGVYNRALTSLEGAVVLGPARLA